MHYKKRFYSSILFVLIVGQTTLFQSFKSGTLYGQETVEPTSLIRTFKLQHRDPVSIVAIISPYTLDNSPSFSHSLRTITVRAYRNQMVEIEKIIKEYDIPLKQVWIQAALIFASGNGDGPVDFPIEIEDVVQKLQSIFKFSKYEVLAQAEAMGLEGSMLKFASDARDTKNPVFEVTSKLGYADDFIKLEDLNVEVYNPQNIGLATTINIRNGEMVILGASKSDALKGSLITVISAKVIE